MTLSEYGSSSDSGSTRSTNACAPRSTMPSMFDFEISRVKRTQRLQRMQRSLSSWMRGLRSWSLRLWCFASVERERGGP